ncbi:hypothetical protein KI387_001603 [Taxus chinensis]|uniref:Chloroplastic lipocalin n=1 Tax=Taxus chinensis TaxID=29808 RepID=A0AA38LP28_TAXCH|nr:hypothetical protein KI387_001603 [Taxus chinensis]
MGSGHKERLIPSLVSCRFGCLHARRKMSVKCLIGHSAGFKETICRKLQASIAAVVLLNAPTNQVVAVESSQNNTCQLASITENSTTITIDKKSEDENQTLMMSGMTAKNFNPIRYSGRWFEVASLKRGFAGQGQEDCHCTQGVYTFNPDNRAIQVDTFCVHGGPDGYITGIRGKVQCLNEAEFEPYDVIATDYDNYALISGAKDRSFVQMNFCNGTMVLIIFEHYCSEVLVLRACLERKDGEWAQGEAYTKACFMQIGCLMLGGRLSVKCLIGHSAGFKKQSAETTASIAAVVLLNAPTNQVKSLLWSPHRTTLVNLHPSQKIAQLYTIDKKNGYITGIRGKVQCLNEAEFVKAETEIERQEMIKEKCYLRFPTLPFIPKEPYDVIATDYDNYALISGAKDRSFVQIYSRTPNPGPDFIENFKTYLTSFGYDPSQIKDTPQDCEVMPTSQLAVMMSLQEMQQALTNQFPDLGLKRSVQLNPLTSVLDTFKKLVQLYFNCRVVAFPIKTMSNSEGSEGEEIQMAMQDRGVKGCERISLAEKTEVTRLHMEGETMKKGMPLETTQVPIQCVDVESQIGGDYAKGKRKTSTVTGMFNVQSREVADSSIAKFFFANAIPFHVSRSPFFKQMFKDVIVVGSSYVPLGEHKLRTSLLDKEYSKVSVVMEETRQTWIWVGCSIIMDGWIDIKHRPLINIIVTCPADSYFLRAIDCPGKRKDATFQFQNLKDAIEEIGPSHVV